ncbi:MAG: ABC transporter substrate-binding protein [Bacteroidota bacterium]|nr:ABC transporter substrate-binding protein [Bacteroidota bacterium]
MYQKLIGILLFALILTAYQGCNSAEQTKNVFYWNIAGSFTGCDPAFANTQANTWVVNQIFDGLVALDDSLHLRPAIASRWEVSPNQTKYTFHLRNDVYFQDDECFANGKGRRVVAKDVVYSYKRLLDKSLASRGNWVFDGKVKTDEADNYAFYAPNDSTVELDLIKPFSPFLQLLSLKYCSIIPHEAVESYKKNFRTHPVGTGPYQVFEFRENEKLILHPNKNYYQNNITTKAAKLSAVSISFINSKQNEFFSFISHRLSMMVGLDASFINTILDKSGKLKPSVESKYQVHKNPFLNTEYIGINLDPNKWKNTPLSNKQFRQAINYAIDKEKLVRYMRNGIGQPANSGFIPPSLSSNTRYYPYNPQKAKLLLKEASSKVDIHEEIVLNTIDQYVDISVFLQQELKQYGINVKIETVPGAALSDLKTTGKAQLCRASWVADYANPENYLSLFYSKNWTPKGDNYFHYKNPLFDKYYEQLISGVNTELNLVTEMQNILTDDCPFIILFYDESVRLVHNNIRGLKTNPINMIDLRGVYIE